MKAKSGKNENADMLDALKEEYARFCAERRADPFFSPVLRLALSIGNRIQDGSLTVPDMEGAVERLTINGLLERSRRLGVYLGDCAPRRNEEALGAAIRSLASGKSFDEFRAAVERVHYGFVFTAHPTFTLTREQTRALAACAASPDPKTESALRDAATQPFTAPDLEEENAFSLEAIGTLHEAVALLYRIVYDVAAREYPDRWTDLRPRLCSVATWVGFDLDGRNDIGWTSTLSKRFLLQTLQLEAYLRQMNRIMGSFPECAPFLKPACALIETTLSIQKAHADFFAAYDPDTDPGHEALQRESRAMVESAATRLTGPEPLIDLLQDSLKKTVQADARKDILVLISRLESFGLSFAEVHFRINAAQIHNTMRKSIDLTTHPADPRFRQSYMDRLLEKFRAIGPDNIHFGNILEEQASARRLFMLIQQIVKHIDGHSPIRFLIAETESSFTVMTALYHARRFGLEDHIDICPLFETERALQRGSRIVDHLLAIPEYRSYIRKRGRLCVQTGYSDAGRYIGQTPAAGSIERLKERIVRLMKDYDLGETGVLFFDTHGESVGRGGHPGGMAERMAYIAPPALRRTITECGLSLVQESSFQGGDGYAYFMAPETCLAALTRILEVWLSPPAAPRHDPFYEDRAVMTEFFTIVKEMQADFMASHEYGVLLSAFGANLLRASGSRAVKRQYDYRKGEPQERSAREFRAIPHNAILAQMGLLVNTVSGLGTAIEADMPLYRHMMDSSPRFRSLMTLALRGADLSDPDTMKAYIDTLDPMLWLMRQAHTDDSEAARAYAAIAAQLEQHSPFGAMSAVFRTIYRDFTAFREAAGAPDARPGEPETAMACLHAIRIALIHRIYMLAMDIPGYSPQHEMGRDALIGHILRLDVPMAVEELREIFPVRRETPPAADYGEQSAYRNEDKESYAAEQAGIFDPMLRLYETVRKISTAIAHHAGFIG